MFRFPKENPQPRQTLLTDRHLSAEHLPAVRERLVATRCQRWLETWGFRDWERAIQRIIQMSEEPPEPAD